MAKEKNFENRFKRWLKSKGIYPLGYPSSKMDVPACGYYEKRWGGGVFTTAGLPDMHICINGKSFEVELKAEDGRPSEVQKLIIRQINACGGYGEIVYPSDYERIKEFIEKEIANGHTK